MDLGVTKILLIEDDEDDYILTRLLLSEIRGHKFSLEWARDFEQGLEQLRRNECDVALVDYRLGARNGVELLKAAEAVGCQSPVILLTGSGQHQVDLEAMQAGAADYLVKAQLQPNSLERSIRYAIQRDRAAKAALTEQARLAKFGAEVGLALTQRDSLEAILRRCATAMTLYLNAAIAQISIFDPVKGVFELRATAGSLLDPNASLSQKSPIALSTESLAAGLPVFIRQLNNERALRDPAWVQREQIASFAAYPLLLEGRLVGMVALYSRQPLPEQVCQELGSVAHGISLCIERKRSEQALDASETKYRSVVENIKEIIFQLDEFGQWTFLNPAWSAVTGFEVNRTLGTFFLEYLHEEDREQNRHIFLKLIEGKLDYCRYETRFLTKDGKVRWVEVYAQPNAATDSSLGVSGTLTDITERKMAESAIQKLAAFPKVNPNPVLEFSADGTMTYANDAARELVVSLGKTELAEILPPDAAAVAREALARSQKNLRREVRLNGHTITWSFFPVAASQVIHCYGADVTEMLSLEAQLRHAQKLESVGQLAAGIAHDFNNLLTVIQGYTETLLQRGQKDPMTNTALKQIADASKRAAALTRQLLMFSRKQVIQTAVLDLNSVLQNVANMLTRLLGENVRLRTDYAAELPRIEADTGMLEQVVMNLAVNARDAMPEGGELIIETQVVLLGENYVEQHPEACVGRFVCLTVQDSGCGMDRKTLERIFEPFFTTKEVGKGTGLGLATVYGIVKQHRGWIEVESAVGKGSTFKVYLPALAKEAESSTTQLSSESESLAGGEETILVVEDEPVLRELVVDVLSQYNYKVVQACSGNEALRTWDEVDGQVDLLLTDMVMPEGMSGRDLANQLKQRKPDLKVIYSSGYSPEAIGRDFGQGDTVFLQKPYVPPQLAQTVRQCLDGHWKRSHKGAAP